MLCCWFRRHKVYNLKKAFKNSTKVKNRIIDNYYYFWKKLTGMFKEKDFEDIRPYRDDEINPALKRIISNPAFDKILDFFLPDEGKDKIKDLLVN